MEIDSDKLITMALESGIIEGVKKSDSAKGTATLSKNS